MAWRSSGSSNQSLIDNLEKNGLIETKRVKDAMLQVLPTTIFVSDRFRENTNQATELTLSRSTARTTHQGTPTMTDRSP